MPWLARIPQRTAYIGEMRWGIVNDRRRLDRRALPRLVDRYAALAGPAAGAAPVATTGPVLVPDSGNRDAAITALDLASARPVAILCPGAEFGPAKRWPAGISPTSRGNSSPTDCRSGCSGSPNDKPATEAVLTARRHGPTAIRDLSGRTDLGTAIDLLSLASIVVSNDSGLMHAAAAVGVPLVALFGSSSPCLYAADVASRQDRAHRHRLQSVLQARVPAGTLQVHARSRSRRGV